MWLSSSLKISIFEILRKEEIVQGEPSQEKNPRRAMLGEKKQDFFQESNLARAISGEQAGRAAQESDPGERLQESNLKD